MSGDMGDNPYEASDIRMDGTRSSGSSGQVPGGVIYLLEETRPWVRLIGIVLRVLGVLAIIAGVFMLLFGVLGAGLGGAGGMFAGGIGALVGGLYILVAILYIVPSGFLLKYGASIRALSDTDSFDDLEDAVAFQKSFWKFAGIVTVIYLVLLVLYLVVMFGLGFMGAMM